MKYSIFLLLVIFSISAVAQTNLYKEKYRPRFHFSPEKNWCNDPNGLVYNNGLYHLFYQHNPFGNIWGHMTWAHAISQDLLHWKHLPIAIPEENGTMIFSGTCVVDKNNTSGFGKNETLVKPANKKALQVKAPMVAVYTGHVENVNQSQCIAYSLDSGITWTKYAGNPVLDLHKKDFRDPKIFWYPQKKYWVMALMFPNEHLVQFYSSKNLKQWNHLSDFGPAGDTSAVWECPDLTEVPVKGVKGKKKWLLQTSQNGGMQYFVGEFDGISFINENPPDKIVKPDYGPDYYAAIAFNQLPATSLPTTIGWINNWNYANDIPTTPWKGAMSLPRNMSVKKVNDDPGFPAGRWVLVQKPVEKIISLRQKILLQSTNEIVAHTKTLNVKSQQCEIELLLEPSAKATAGIKLATGNSHELEIGYDAVQQVLYIDRSKTANQPVNENFKNHSRYQTKIILQNRQLKLHIFFDHSIVEIFANNGEAVITVQIFPDENDNGIELFSNGADTKAAITVWKMKTVW